MLPSLVFTDFIFVATISKQFCEIISTVSTAAVLPQALLSCCSLYCSSVVLHYCALLSRFGLDRYGSGSRGCFCDVCATSPATGARGSNAAGVEHNRSVLLAGKASFESTLHLKLFLCALHAPCHTALGSMRWDQRCVRTTSHCTGVDAVCTHGCHMREGWQNTRVQ